MPPTSIEKASPTATMPYVGQNGASNIIVNCVATVNVEAVKIMPVTIIFHTKLFIFFVSIRQITNTRNVAIPPTGTSTHHIGEKKFAITTPSVTAII